MHTQRQTHTHARTHAHIHTHTHTHTRTHTHTHLEFVHCEALEVEVCVLPVGLAWSDADEGVWPRLEHGAQDPAPQRQVLQSACRREGEGEGLCLYVSVSVSVSVCVCVCLCVAASLTANAISKKEMSDDHGRSLHSTRQRFKLWRPGHMDTQGEGM